VSIRGKQWRIGQAHLRRNGVRGLCMTAKQAGLPNLIVICSTMPKRGPMRLRTAIHETLHAAMPRATEQQVRETADVVAKVLTKLGYRRSGGDQ
jgi:hypothetical protein